MSGETTKNTDITKGYPSPFCLRLTFEERALLEMAAGDKPLGAYIRSRLLGGNEVQRKRKFRRPVKDHKALGQVLGELGKSRLANNLNQLAKGVNTGSLPVTPDTEKAIREACANVEQMRTMLLIALGYLPREEKP